MNNKNKLIEFLKTLSDNELKEAMVTMAILTDPLSIELIKRAAEKKAAE